MNVCVLADLDTNLIHNRHEYQRAVGDLASAILVSRPGAPEFYMSPASRALMEIFSLAGATIVPTTGRTTKSIATIDLGITPGWRIASFGGVIMTPDGTAEPGWHARMLSESELYQSELCKVLSILHAAAADTDCGDYLEIQVISDAGLDLYLKARGTPERLADLDRYVRPLLPQGWLVHTNGLQFCVQPPYLGKQQAVQYFVEELAGPFDLVIGSGDSQSDLAFMSACQFALCPTSSQIWHALVDRIR